MTADAAADVVVGAEVAVTAAPARSNQTATTHPALRSGGSILLLPTMVSSTAEPPEVLKALVENHHRFLAFLEKRVGSRQEAEDILQDGFVKALERSGGLKQESSVIPWFYRLLRNAVTDYYRQRGAETRALAEAGGREDTSIEMDDTALHETVCGCVLGLLETLKPEYASALKAVDVLETPVSEYAKELGITSNNAAVRLHRAREALRKQVIRCCGTCTTHGCEDCRCGKA